MAGVLDNTTIADLAGRPLPETEQDRIAAD